MIPPIKAESKADLGSGFNLSCLIQNSNQKKAGITPPRREKIITFVSLNIFLNN